MFIYVLPLIAKDCLLTCQEQACTRTTTLYSPNFFQVWKPFHLQDDVDRQNIPHRPLWRSPRQEPQDHYKKRDLCWELLWLLWGRDHFQNKRCWQVCGDSTEKSLFRQTGAPNMERGRSFLSGRHADVGGRRAVQVEVTKRTFEFCDMSFFCFREYVFVGDIGNMEIMLKSQKFGVEVYTLASVLFIILAFSLRPCFCFIQRLGFCLCFWPSLGISWI